jgi:hypothetical protein
LGPVERANLDQRRLVRSTGPNWIGFTLLSLPEDGDRASLQNVVIYRRNRTMDIVHKHSSLVHHVPLSKFLSSIQIVTVLTKEKMVSGLNIAANRQMPWIVKSLRNINTNLLQNPCYSYHMTVPAQWHITHHLFVKVCEACYQYKSVLWNVMSQSPSLTHWYDGTIFRQLWNDLCVN